MELLYYFSSLISCYIQDVQDVPLHAQDDNLAIYFIYILSPKIDPTNEGTLVEIQNMNTSFKDFSPKDEVLEYDVHSSPKMQLPHKDHLMQGYDIVATFPSGKIPSFHFNYLPPRDEALMIYTFPFSKDCLNHQHTLEQEDDTISLIIFFYCSLSKK